MPETVKKANLQESDAEPAPMTENNNSSDNKQDETSVEMSQVEQPQPQPQASVSLVKDVVDSNKLQSEWTFWVLEMKPSKQWEDMLHEILTFDTMGNFWTLYNRIKGPSQLRNGCDYSVFRKGIRPMWEDEANQNGGRWLFNVPRANRDELDWRWGDVLVCLFGEIFPDPSQICGAVVNIRKRFDRIAIWTKDGNDEAAVAHVGNKMRDTLRLKDEVLRYELHRDGVFRMNNNIDRMSNVNQ